MDTARRPTFLLVRAALVALLGAVMGGCAAASGSAPVEAELTVPGSAEARAELALRLAGEARRSHDARAMLVAARMMLTSGTRPAVLENGAMVAEVEGDAVAHGWAREAIALAADDAALVGEAEQVLAMRPRGVLRSSLGGGPLRYVRRVSANESVRFDIATQPQVPARLAAIGDGDARIGLVVSVGSARICDQRARSTHSLCTWQAASERHDVTLINAGPLASDVMILSN